MVHEFRPTGSSLRDLQLRLSELEHSFRAEKDDVLAREIGNKMSEVRDEIARKRASDTFARDAGQSGKIVTLKPK